MGMQKRSEITNSELAEDFRNCLRTVGASVALIATQIDTARFGMTATAIMSVSMDPPSLVVGVNRAASIYGPLLETGAFAVNYLTGECAALARDFSAAAPAQRFSFGTWQDRHLRLDGLSCSSLPYLAEAQATIYCSVIDVHVFGTHGLILGKVLEIQNRDEGSSLLYCRGRYGTFIQSSGSDASKAG